MASLEQLARILEQHLPEERLLATADVQRLVTDPRDRDQLPNIGGLTGALMIGGARVARRVAQTVRGQQDDPAAELRLSRRTSDLVPDGWSTWAVGTGHLAVFGATRGSPFLGSVPRADITKVHLDRVARLDTSRQLSLVFTDRSYVSVRRTAGWRLAPLAALLEPP